MSGFKTLHAHVTDQVLQVATIGDLPADAVAGDVRYVESAGTLYVYDGSSWTEVAAGGGGGTGDVSGPASSTDTAVALFDGTGGKDLKNSVVTVSGAGAVAGVTSLNGVTADEIDNLAGTTGSVQSQIDTVDAALDTHIADTSNPHSVTKSQVGLGNVDNTSDAAKNAAAATLTNKTIVAADNTVTTAASGNLAATELNAALAELQTDIDTRATSAALTSHAALGAAHGTTGPIVGTTDNQTLTNKTIVVSSNTITTAASGNLIATELNNALAELQTDIDGRQPIDSDLTAIAGLSSTGMISRTGSGTAAARTITAGSTKVSITNGDGVSGNPTVDLGNITGNTGNLVQTGSNTYTARTITGGSSKVTVTNGDGVSGNPTIDINGSPELNLIAYPSSATGWSETGTRFNNYPITTTTTGDLPLSGMVSTAIQMVSSTTVAGDETTDYVSYAFTTPASYAVKTKVEFWMRPGSNFVASEWTVSVYAGSTRQTLTTDSSGFTYLPNASGKFTTYFDAVASTAYTLRFTRKVAGAASAATLNIANVIVGPGIQPAGAGIGPTTNYTPTYSAGFGTVANSVVTYQLFGDKLIIEGSLNAGTVGGTALSISMPSGFTIKSNANGTSGRAAVGKFWASTTSAETFLEASGNSGAIFFDGSDLSNLYAANKSGGTGTTLQKVGGTGCLGNGGIFSFFAIVTVNESATTVNLAAGGSPNSQVRVDTGNGHGSTNTKIRRFSGTATTVGSAITYADSAANGASFTINETGVYSAVYVDVKSGGASIIGVSINGSGTTSIETLSTANKVAMASGVSGNYASVSATFRASAGDVVRPHTDGSPDYTGDRCQFTITKVADAVGQAVGFGEVQPGVSSGLVSASGLKGRTDGAAVASGYVGEKVEATQTSATTITTSGTYQDLGSVSLTAGIWMINLMLTFDLNGATCTQVFGGIGTASGGGTTGLVQGMTQTNGIAPTSTSDVALSVPGYIVNITATTTYYAKVTASFSAGNPRYKGRITAVRIA